MGKGYKLVLCDRTGEKGDRGLGEMDQNEREARRRRTFYDLKRRTTRRGHRLEGVTTRGEKRSG